MADRTQDLNALTKAELRERWDTLKDFLAEDCDSARGRMIHDLSLEIMEGVTPPSRG